MKKAATAWGWAFRVASPLLVACASDAIEKAGEKAGEQARASATGIEPLPGDIAVAFSLKETALPRASDSLAPGQPLFSRPTYQAVANAFLGTVAEGGFDGENAYEDLRLVSFRVAPCSPLGVTPHADLERLCWPELRLVFQPVVSKIRVREVYSETYADDRAIHVLYDAPPGLALTAAETLRAEAYVDGIRRAHQTPATTFAPLADDALRDFEGLRNQVAKAYLQGALQLRQATTDTKSLRTLGPRPESQGTVEEQAVLRTGALRFLAQTLLAGGRARAPKMVTAFSLPPGRGPADMDAWLFVSLSPTSQGLVPEPHRIHSAIDGRVLFEGETVLEASMTTDNESLQNALSSGPHAQELGQTVAIRPAEVQTLAKALVDRSQILVENTACTTCHRLGSQRFDFHAFSYLEDRDLSVSPRVTRDVELDLAWIRSRLGPL